MPQRRDDSLMSRFDEHGLRRFNSRQAVISVAMATVLLVMAAGGSIRKAGEEMNPGIGRDIVLAVGKPAAWIADQLPVHDITHDVTAWLSPDTSLSGVGGAFTAATIGS